MLEFLGFCVILHSHTARNYFLRHLVLRNVANLFSLNSDIISLGITLSLPRSHLACIRLFRCVIQTKDEYYLRHLVKLDLLSPVVRCLQTNGMRYNLLDSAILDVFELIRKVSTYLDAALCRRKI
jgi:protein phosphatase-4 regulatory subunit 3